MLLENKYLVLKIKDIENLPEHLKKALEEIVSSIKTTRRLAGKEESPSYIVINKNWTSAYDAAYRGLIEYIKKENTEKLVQDVINVLEAHKIAADHRRWELVKLLREIGNGQ